MSVAAAGPGRAALRVLVVDDDALARRALVRMLAADHRVGEVRAADGAGVALRVLAERPPAVAFDAVLCAVGLRGLGGVALARVVARFAAPPRVVLLGADAAHAVEAFDVAAVDYLLTPVRPERLHETVRRLHAREPLPAVADRGEPDETIAVELAGVITLLHRADVLWAEADGDYVRLHTATGSHLVRTTLAALERRWAEAGFVRVHRHALVALAHVDAARLGEAGHEVVVGAHHVPVSRRHAGDVRARLLAGG